MFLSYFFRSMASTSTVGLVTDSEGSTSDEEFNSGISSGNSKCHGKPMTSSAKKRKKFTQGFRNEWLQNTKFKSWLQAPSKGSIKPVCNFCLTTVPCGKSGLERHAKSAMHMKNTGLQNSQMSINQAIQNSVQNCNFSLKTESRVCAFLAEHNLSFSLSQPLLKLIKASCPTNTSEKEKLQNLKMSSTKCTNIIRQGLGFHFSKDLVDKLKVTKFSVIPDESTDVSSEKQLAICVMYYDYDSHEVVTSFFDIVKIKKCDAESLYAALKTSFEEKNIPLTNIIGYCSDTCNTMFGEHRSVTSLMKADLPHVTFVRCSCHMIHLCVSHACLKLSVSLEDLCRNIFSYFSRSSVRRHELEEFQEFVNVTPHKLLCYGQTRWLSLEACVTRILEQWDALRLYFTSVVSEKKDPSYVTESILTSLQNPFIKAQLEFMEVQLKRTNEFNKIFQSDKPMLHSLDSRLKMLLAEVMSDYMNLKYVRECNPYTIDFQDEKKRVPINQVYIGMNATETLSNPPACHDKEGIKIFKHNCLSFLMELTFQIRSRFTTYSLAFLDFINPENALNRHPNSLINVFKAMPYLGEICCKEMADMEWRQVALEGKFRDVKEPVEFWQKQFQQVSINDEKKYPNLCKVVGTALSLPHSNASVERIFSQLRRIKTDMRNSLKEESLVGLLHTKYGLKRKGITSDQLQVSEQLIKDMKKIESSATDAECKKILLEKFK